MTATTVATDKSACANTPAVRPRTLFWEVTNRCNLGCEHCYNKVFLNDKRNSLSFEDGKRRCEQIILDGFEKVVFLGGEPLSSRHLFDYIAILSEGGVRSSISTNGTLLTRERARRMAELGVSLVAVSLDSGDAILNDRVRGEGTFRRIVNGLQLLAANRIDSQPRVVIACTLAPENQGHYSKLFELARSMDIIDIFFNKYMKVNESNLTISSAEGFLRELDEICHVADSHGDLYLYLPTMPRVADALNAKYGRIRVFAKESSCPAVDDAILLSDDGKVYPCSMARVEHPEFGAVFDGSLHAALQQGQVQDFVELRRRLRDNDPEICVRCAYRSTCATRCTLTHDQTKYYLACESLERFGPAIGLNPAAAPAGAPPDEVNFD